MSNATGYRVETSKGKGSYSSRFGDLSERQAWFYYSGLNAHSGYNKRLVAPDGKVLARFRTGS